MWETDDQTWELGYPMFRRHISSGNDEKQPMVLGYLDLYRCFTWSFRVPRIEQTWQWKFLWGNHENHRTKWGIVQHCSTPCLPECTLSSCPHWDSPWCFTDCDCCDRTVILIFLRTCGHMDRLDKPWESKSIKIHNVQLPSWIKFSLTLGCQVSLAFASRFHDFLEEVGCGAWEVIISLQLWLPGPCLVKSYPNFMENKATDFRAVEAWLHVALMILGWSKLTNILGMGWNQLPDELLLPSITSRSDIATCEGT